MFGTENGFLFFSDSASDMMDESTSLVYTTYRQYTHTLLLSSVSVTDDVCHPYNLRLLGFAVLGFN